MIKLSQYEPALGLPSASPFCMKLETCLRMTQVARLVEGVCLPVTRCDGRTIQGSIGRHE
jgi:hypothetical protein